MIFCRPLPPDDLARIIFDACGEDLSTASLTQVSSYLSLIKYLYVYIKYLLIYILTCFMNVEYR
mgnify:CR=1 FL=1